MQLVEGVGQVGGRGRRARAGVGVWWCKLAQRPLEQRTPARNRVVALQREQDARPRAERARAERGRARAA
eukprot:CAMPEP_0179841810 /NCGR_PEP_ID=MMETSP0982-20121206/2760_1 /TAXON_ID=483367 /ORGANISM="non described non described, Strain CCMP 2436" /LENGTH=69 /DNA_ID=CAMNT_0021725977 /DNA_START=368 /DNA_END=577 /DNA_ORIENTATION=+